MIHLWQTAKEVVKDIFFKDKIELYKNTIRIDTFGEERFKEVLVGTYECNLQYEPAEVVRQIMGTEIGHVMRVSISKDIPLDYNYTYKLKIKEARIRFDNRYWKIESWKEGQISTVITAIKEVSV